MTLAAYRGADAFAYPGWRLTVPGGPAGGHYKGFTHTQAAGTTILPEDQYELDRSDGMSSHDTVYASRRNPRGIYRSSAEVPPRANASGKAHVYRSFQTQRHAGTSVAPGSFPADYFQTNEDDVLSLAQNAPKYLNPEAMLAQNLFGLGALPIADGGGSEMIRYPGVTCPSWGCGAPPTPTILRPNTTMCPLVMPPGSTCVDGQIVYGSEAPPVASLPATGATSSVAQPAPTPTPLPPSPSVSSYTPPPISPTPAPIVATNEVIPLNDGSGNYLNVSTGQIIPASAVTQNLATMQLTASTAVATDPMAWLESSSIISGVPNWGLLAAGLAAAALLMGKRR